MSQIVEIALKLLIIVVPVLIGVAYFTHVERKILGAMQRRRGPNVVGVYGLLQPLADGLKLFIKESVIPSTSNTTIFKVAPLLCFSISLISWALIPYSEHSFFSESDISFLIILGISSVGVYGIIMSGWASNSKYSFLGSLRSTSQMVSYELSISFIVITICICNGTFSVNNLVSIQKEGWFFVTYFPLFIIFCICALAETNRHPFDLPEAEAELVSGYNVEYSAMGFALFSLAEYANILVMSCLIVILFFGGWTLPCFLLDLPCIYANGDPIRANSYKKNNNEKNSEKELEPTPDEDPLGGIILTNKEYTNVTSDYTIHDIFTILPAHMSFGIKVCGFVIFFVVMRAILPRYRYDQLMNIGWKIVLPSTLIGCLITIGSQLSYVGLPL